MIIRTILFYFLAFLFTMVLGGTQQATGLPTSLPQWGPGVAGLLMAYLIFRKQGTKLNFSFKSAAPQTYLLAFLIPALPAAVVFIIMRLLGANASFQFEFSLFAFLNMASGALGEEIGWRGYFHKMLNQKTLPVITSAVVGVLWGLWHIGLYANGALYMVFAVILITSYTYVLYSLMPATKFNIWVAALFHLGINLSNMLFFEIITTTQFMMVNALVWAVFAMIIVLRQKSLYFTRQG